MTVADVHGGSTTAIAALEVQNVAPTLFDPVDQFILEGDTVNFNVQFSDPGADALTLTADWNDQVDTYQLAPLTTSASVSRTFFEDDPTPRMVTLQVTDDDGDSSLQQTAFVTVQNAPPAPAMVVNPSGPNPANTTIAFTAIANDPGIFDTHTYEWTFGDGQTATGLTANHAYSSTGSYNVTLKVTDDEGDSARSTASFKWLDQPTSFESSEEGKQTLSIDAALSMRTAALKRGPWQDCPQRMSRLLQSVDVRVQDLGSNYLAWAIHGTQHRSRRSGSIPDAAGSDGT